MNLKDNADPRNHETLFTFVNKNYFHWLKLENQKPHQKKH